MAEAEKVWVCEQGHVDDHHYTRNEPGQPELCSRCGGKCEAVALDGLARRSQQRDELLAAIEDHKAACEYASPEQYVDQDRDLYRAAERVRKGNG